MFQRKPTILVYSTQLMATGGIESHLLEFCKQMSEQDIVVDLVVLNARMLPVTERTYRQVCRRLYLGRRELFLASALWFLYVAFRLALRRYDAFYSNGQGESIWPLSRCVRFNGRWVHHHHMSGDQDDRDTWGVKYQRVLKEASSVIACSRSNATEMSSFLKRGIDSIPCFSRKVGRRKNMGSTGPARKVRFGYFGRLIPEKGIDTICRLSEDVEMKQVEFHIWGEGMSYPASFFNTFPKVCYHGTFSGSSALVETIGSIDAFLLLSTHREGLPICLLEAMSAGLPWLATDRGGISDIACDPRSTRVLRADATYDEIKRAILAFAEDIAGGKVSGDVQESLYDSNFSTNVLVHKWCQLLGV